MVRYIFVLLVVVIASMPAYAEHASDWVVRDGVRVRLVAGYFADTPHVAVQLQLADGWHSYWRYPGASGIAPEFDWSQSRNATFGDAIFPAPYFFDDDAGGFYGYEGAVAFAVPFTQSDPRTPSDIKLNLFAGVCREICVPVQLELALHVPHLAATHDKSDVIADIYAARPQAPSADMAITHFVYDGAALRLTLTGRDLRDPQIMVIPAPESDIGAPHIVKRQGDAIEIELPAHLSLDQSPIGRKLTFVVRDGVRAIEQTIIVP